MPSAGRSTFISTCDSVAVRSMAPAGQRPADPHGPGEAARRARRSRRASRDSRRRRRRRPSGTRGRRPASTACQPSAEIEAGGGVERQAAEEHLAQFVGGQSARPVMASSTSATDASRSTCLSRGKSRVVSAPFEARISAGGAERRHRFEPQRRRGREPGDQPGPDAVASRRGPTRRSRRSRCAAAGSAAWRRRRRSPPSASGWGVPRRPHRRRARHTPPRGGEPRRAIAERAAARAPRATHRGRWRSWRSRRSSAARSTSTPSPASARSSADAASGRLPSAASTSA